MGSSTVASELEQALAQAVKDGKIPHAICYATNRDGSFQYHHATGLQHYGVDDEPIQEDAVLMLASQTKLLTSIAALQAVEQGVLGLDDDVTPHIPELVAFGIIKGYDEKDQPILEKVTKKITLRHLLTHSSGANYPMTADILKFQAQRNRTDPSNSGLPTVPERYDHPLMFAAGESWMYSPGLDWTGLLLHRLTGLTLEEWMKKNIFLPLGITGITFWPKNDPSLKDKIPQLVARTPDGALAPTYDDTINTHSTDCFGGHGAFAKMGEYLKVLHSLLRNDGKLLESDSVDMLFAPQLGEKSAAAFNEFRDSFGGYMIGELRSDIPVNHGLGGALFMADDVGRRKKGTMYWGGLVNPFWLIDREAGIALTFGTQVMPPGDSMCKEMTGIFERAIYKMAGVEMGEVCVADE